MDVKEIRTLPEDEIGAEIEKARAKVFKMRFQGKGENVENPGSLRSLRRHIARLKTVIRERQLGAGLGTGPAPARSAPVPPRPAEEAGGEA